LLVLTSQQPKAGSFSFSSFFSAKIARSQQKTLPKKPIGREKWDGFASCDFFGWLNVYDRQGNWWEIFLNKTRALLLFFSAVTLLLLPAAWFYRSPKKCEKKKWIFYARRQHQEKKYGWFFNSCKIEKN
jgi:hypothetical protein